MKHLYSTFGYGLLVCSLLVSTYSWSQCEADFDFGEALWGASPDASIGEQFDTAFVDTPYMDVFHVLVPTDASVINPAADLPLDSVVLVSTTLVDTISLATLDLEEVGLSVVCNNLGTSPNPCTFISGEQYCASLEGTPTLAGVYQMTLNVEAYVTVFGFAVAQPYQFTGYIMDIVGDDTNGVSVASEMNQIELYPNPTDGIFNVGNLTESGVVVVRDMAGRIMDQRMVSPGSTMTIDSYGWTSGIYFVKVETTSYHYTSRLVVKH
ncbi:MAG: T9SS type A sorting domain-containing protein [Flavobacteriales bacterium]